nr:GPN-loop GTPase 3 [Seculamonas ecuadoriensis]
MRERCENGKRVVHVVNLDPAAEDREDFWSIDIKNLVSLSDVMEEMNLGPNGGLLFCMEYLIENMEWFKEELGEYDDDYLIVDCPGQIELYSHVPVMKKFIHELQLLGYTVCCVYLLDSQFIEDPSKFVSGMLACLSAMVQLETPHINVLTKCDLLGVDLGADEDDFYVNRYLLPDASELVQESSHKLPPKFREFNSALASVIDNFNLISFVPLNITSEDSIDVVLGHIDQATQFGEDDEVRDKMPEQEGEPDDDDDGWVV